MEQHITRALEETKGAGADSVLISDCPEPVQSQYVRPKHATKPSFQKLQPQGHTMARRSRYAPQAVSAWRFYRQLAPLRAGSRSEEHTSELQSRGHLVCRLLLEKKKKC